MIAAARISKEPEAYGFHYVKPHEPWSFEELHVGPGTPLTTIARVAGTTVDVLRVLNPQIKQARTRRDEPAIVRVPRAVEPTRDAALLADASRNPS